jgi:glucose-6-phosphate isomerase
MSVIRPKPPEDPLHYDPAGVLAAGGLSRSSLEGLVPRLEHARRESLADLDRWRSGRGAEGAPLGPAFIDQPERLLADYGTRRPESELFAVLTVARRIREAVDRVVVLGAGGSLLGARGVFEACCHPFHNELSRGERGGRPRLSFEGFAVDNDSAQGLLDLVAPPGGVRGPADLLQRWAIVVVDGSGETLETAVATRLFLKPLFEGVGCDRRRLAELVVPVAGRTGRLADLARTVGCPDVFTIPDGVGGRFSAFTAAGLLPAAIVGIDVVRLLEGAAAMNRRFREAPVADNPVLQCAGASHLAESALGATVRVLAGWSNRLEGIGRWYDHLFSESLGAAECGATSLTPVTDGDSRERGQQHQRGCCQLVTNLLVGEPRRDRLTLPALAGIAADEDGLDGIVGTSWPDLLAAAAAVAGDACAADHRPTADILLPRIDEHAVGQLLQMLMLATVVEGRLVGANPYGPPGAEAARRLVMARLRPG